MCRSSLSGDTRQSPALFRKRLHVGFFVLEGGVKNAFWWWETIMSLPRMRWETIMRLPTGGYFSLCGAGLNFRVLSPVFLLTLLSTHLRKGSFAHAAS